MMSTAATTATTVDLCVLVKPIAATTATTTVYATPTGCGKAAHTGTYIHTPIHNDT